MKLGAKTWLSCFDGGPWHQSSISVSYSFVLILISFSTSTHYLPSVVWYPGIINAQTAVWYDEYGTKPNEVATKFNVESNYTTVFLVNYLQPNFGKRSNNALEAQDWPKTNWRTKQSKKLLSTFNTKFMVIYLFVVGCYHIDHYPNYLVSTSSPLLVIRVTPQNQITNHVRVV